MEKTKEAGGVEPLLHLKPYYPKKAAMIITGSEVYSGRIKDQFGPAIEQKLQEFHVEIIGKTIVGDQPEAIVLEIKKYLDQGADMILCTGGMSVDPDDTTPTAIIVTGGRYSFLWCTGVAGRHVPVGLHQGRHSYHGVTGMRYVFEKNHFRFGSA